MENWILDEYFDCIRINGIPVLEQSFNVTEESKKIILLASKAPEILESLKELISWSAHLPQIANRDIERAQQLIKEATTI